MMTAARSALAFVLVSIRRDAELFPFVCARIFSDERRDDPAVSFGSIARIKT